jgi:predicted lysophospholipase L1 biosynthesis ABC-type transport system permease subunit
MDKQAGEVSQIQKRICSLAMSLALVFALIFLIFQEKAIAKGLVLGTFFSIINFVLLGKSIPLTLGRSRAWAGFIGLISILSRFIILAVPLIVALKSASFDFIAAIVGIFSVQLVTLLDYVVIRPHFDDRLD